MIRLFILILTLATFEANAQTSPEKVLAAQQVVELMDIKSTFDTVLTQCKSLSGSPFDPKAAFLAAPGSFGGLSPQSAYWPEVEVVYKKYQDRGCGYISAEQFSIFMAEQYAELASLEDLNTYIAFLASPAGQRIKQATLTVNKSIQAFAQERVRRTLQAAYLEAQEELRIIVSRYQKNPR
jgi:hypothetical protein